MKTNEERAASLRESGELEKPDKQDPSTHPCFHIVEEPGCIRHMIGCEVPPAAYYVELLKDMVRRHPKACRHVLEHLLSLEAFFELDSGWFLVRGC